MRGSWGSKHISPRYDLVNARTNDGRAVRLLTVIDEHTRECPAIAVARRITADDVPDRLSALFVLRGVPAHVRSGNGPAFATSTRPSAAAGRQLKSTLFASPFEKVTWAWTSTFWVTGSKVR